MIRVGNLFRDAEFRGCQGRGGPGYGRVCARGAEKNLLVFHVMPGAISGFGDRAAAKTFDHAFGGACSDIIRHLEAFLREAFWNSSEKRRRLLAGALQSSLSSAVRRRQSRHRRGFRAEPWA